MNLPTGSKRALGEMGVEAESDSRVKGKLETMTAHLADMRALAFKALGTEMPGAEKAKE